MWQGGTWHGAGPRTNAGLRVTLVETHLHPHIRTFANRWSELPAELLYENPELKRVLGLAPRPDPVQGRFGIDLYA